jgi:hypothetical protein
LSEIITDEEERGKITMLIAGIAMHALVGGNLRWRGDEGPGEKPDKEREAYRRIVGAAFLLAEEFLKHAEEKFP